MISINYIFVFLSIIFFIGCTQEISISNKSILYDNPESYGRVYQPGDIFIFKNIANIIEITKSNCKELFFLGHLIRSNDSEASRVDYYIHDENTIYAIIPKVDPGVNYSIAIQLDKNPFSTNFLYTNPFEIGSKGNEVILGSGYDYCGIFRTTEISNYNPKEVRIIKMELYESK